MVFSVPGSASILEPLGRCIPNFLSDAGAGEPCNRRYDSATLLNSSFDCLSDGARHSTSEPGRYKAVCKAMMLDIVLLPLCLLQFKRTRVASEDRNSRCQGSGSSPRCSAKTTGLSAILQHRS